MIDILKVININKLTIIYIFLNAFLGNWHCFCFIMDKRQHEPKAEQKERKMKMTRENSKGSNVGTGNRLLKKIVHVTKAIGELFVDSRPTTIPEEIRRKLYY